MGALGDRFFASVSRKLFGDADRLSNGDTDRCELLHYAPFVELQGKYPAQIQGYALPNNGAGRMVQMAHHIS